MSKKILFEGRHGLMDPFVASAYLYSDVEALQSVAAEPPALPGVHFIGIIYGTFGLGPLFRVLSLETATPSYIKKYNKILQKREPDVLVCLDFFRLSFWQAVRYKRTHKKLTLVMFSETKRFPPNILSRCLMRYFLWRVRRSSSYIDRVLVWTDQGKDFFKKQLPQLSVEVVPAGVDDKKFVPHQNKKLPKGVTLRILCNARYAHYKRHQDLFTAVAKLKARGRSVLITCIGRGDSGKEKVVKLASDMGVQDVVTFLDPVPQEELVKIYQQHDVLVLPSYNEAVGMVVPEAMACGLPTITSDTVGANVYVKEGKTGLIYETGNVEALANAIEKLLDNQTRHEMSRAAARHIRENYTVEKCSERFMKALEIC